MQRKLAILLLAVPLLLNACVAELLPLTPPSLAMPVRTDLSLDRERGRRECGGGEVATKSIHAPACTSSAPAPQSTTQIRGRANRHRERTRGSSSLRI